MKPALYLLLVAWAAAVTQEQLDILTRWGLCSSSVTPVNDCTWVRYCTGLRCTNNVLTYIYFDMSVYVALNETERSLFSQFPNVTSLLVTGYDSFAVELYPELSLMAKLQNIQVVVTVTGTIPNELEALTDLSVFIIRSQLSGTIPAGFSRFPMKTFDLAWSAGSNLEGPIPNYTNATTCELSQTITGARVDNPGLFCSCNSSCSQKGSYNRCSVPCGTITTPACNAAVATLGYGYVCIDACSRCRTECLLNADRTAYRCPNDPIPPPPPTRATSESSRTTPTLDGDDRSSNLALKRVVF